jgi:hypothetical protein
MRVARGEAPAWSAGRPRPAEASAQLERASCPHPADVIWKSEVDQLPSHPTRHAVGRYQLARQVSTRLMVLTYVRYQCNGFSCLNSASR